MEEFSLSIDEVGLCKTNQTSHSLFVWTFHRAWQISFASNRGKINSSPPEELVYNFIHLLARHLKGFFPTAKTGA